MASLKEIKRRIGSIKSIWKITSAMRKIASAKLHRAQSAVAGARLYEQQMEGMLSSLLSSEPAHSSRQNSATSCSSPYFVSKGEIKRVAIVVFSSNSSLCGAFNTNVFKKLNATIKERYNHIDRSNILIFPIGRRIHDAVLREGYHPQGDFRNMAEKPDYADTTDLALQLMELFTAQQVDCIELVYNHYKSMAAQLPQAEVWLPLSVAPAQATAGTRTWEAPPDYIVEPSREEMVALLLPKLLKFKLFSTLLDSVTAEHAARTVAMQLATENAEEMINDLTLQYNKSRQQAITNELLDILGGSMR